MSNNMMVFIQLKVLVDELLLLEYVGYFDIEDISGRHGAS
jgi:hypothetical protein